MARIAVALDDEEIGAVGDSDQRLDPFGVAGIGEQRLRRRRGATPSTARRSSAPPRWSSPNVPARRSSRPTSISITFHENRHLFAEERGKKTSRAASSRARVPGGPAINERPFAPGEELGIEQEKRKRAEMVAMQMRKHDAVDTVGIEADAP